MFLIGLGVIDAVILIYKRLSKEYPQSWMKYDFGDLEFGYRNFSKRESFVFPLFLYNGLFAILFVIIIISSLGPIYTWTNNTSLYTSSSNIRQIGVMDGYIKLGGVGHYQTVVSPGTYKILMVKETKSDEKYFITTYTESGEITVTWEWSTLNAGWMPVNYSIDGYTWYNYNDPICISWTLYQRKKYTDINEFEALLKVGKIDVGQ
ncbi:MAG: hypothetical protein GY804_09380 [Alphaproteobacteria bacterium]|nr:hypothetical protein [Alphaproteobacteria bacterium]